jgi:hypothetical protein
MSWLLYSFRMYVIEWGFTVALVVRRMIVSARRSCKIRRSHSALAEDSSLLGVLRCVNW